jgi:predicted transcriptional regulator
MTEDHANALLDMTVGIVANYVSNNQLRPDEISGLIAATHAALSETGTTAQEPASEIDKPTPSQIKRSISDAGLVSFIDGKTYQSLKRHLGTHGYTPESYRETFGLRPDYPMVSPAYAAKRSALAKAIGLGQGGRRPKTTAKVAAKGRKPKA